MGTSNLDIVNAKQFIGPATAGEIPATSGTYFWVHSITGSDGNDGLTPDTALATTAAARGKCTANKGDVIIWMPNHAETFTAAAGFVGSVAGVTYVALGAGADRATFTFSTATTASFDVTADDCRILGFPIGLAGIDGLTKPFNITGNNFYGEIEWRDASSTVEAETAIRLDTADNSVLKLIYKGFTAGNAAVRVVAIDDCDNVSIEIDGYGVVSTAWVNMVDVASTNVSVRGRLYTQGITNFTRDVVDTVTGSTWDAVIFDSSAGAQVSGGSAAALAIDDITALSTKLDTIDDFLDTEMAATLAAVDTEVATIVTSTGTTIPALHAVPTADAATDVNMRDVIGRKTDASQTTTGTAFSLMAYAKGLTNTAYALPRCVEKSDGAVLSGDDNLFDITGGPIHVLSIVGIVTTQIGAGTTNVKLTLTTLEPAATVDMSAGAVDIDGDAAGTSYESINTTAVFTPVTAGFVKHANSFATNPTDFLVPAGTIKLNSSAARAGVIKWYMTYKPLSPNSRVVASA